MSVFKRRGKEGGGRKHRRQEAASMKERGGMTRVEGCWKRWRRRRAIKGCGEGKGRRERRYRKWSLMGR